MPHELLFSIISTIVAALGTVALFLAGFVLRGVRDNLEYFGHKVAKNSEDIAAIKAWCKAWSHNPKGPTSNSFP